MSSSLPVIDVHTVEVASSAERVWHAVTTVLGTRACAWAWRASSVALGCVERRAVGQLGVVGSTIPGFRVVRSDPPLVLGLEGAHRFAVYALEFRVEPVGATRSRLHAESRARFPGPLGVTYRTLVIGSRGHTVAVRGLLRLMKRAAEANDDSAAPSRL